MMRRHGSAGPGRHLDCMFCRQQPRIGSSQQQLAAIVWGAIFSHDLIFFSAHPVSDNEPVCSPSFISLTACSSLIL